MAEAAGIALAVAGLFPLCVDGFNLIKDCFTAPKDAEDGWNRIFIQSGVCLFNKRKLVRADTSSRYL